MIFQCLEHKWLKEVVDKLSGTVIRWSLVNHHFHQHCKSRRVLENKDISSSISLVTSDEIISQNTRTENLRRFLARRRWQRWQRKRKRQRRRQRQKQRQWYSMSLGVVKQSEPWAEWLEWCEEAGQVFCCFTSSRKYWYWQLLKICCLGNRCWFFSKCSQ